MVSDRNPYKILQVDAEATGPVIEAAYKVLRKQRQPGGDDINKRWKSELDWAYTLLRSPASRHGYDRDRRWGRLRPVGPGADVDVIGPSYLESGPYAGWSVTDVAAHDPDYLRWLSRQPIDASLQGAIRSALTTPADRVR